MIEIKCILYYSISWKILPTGMRNIIIVWMLGTDRKTNCDANMLIRLEMCVCVWSTAIIDIFM